MLSIHRPRPMVVAVLVSLLLVLFAAMGRPAIAQRRPLPARPPVPPAGPGARDDAPRVRTTVMVELLLDRLTPPTAAQHWGSRLQEMGFTARIRQPGPADEVEIREATRGGTRVVTAVGLLDRGGAIVFPERRFTRDEAQKLGEYLRELETFGAQGAPDGQPLWGLNREQFDVVFAALSEPLEQDIDGLPLVEAVRRMGIPEAHPVRLTPEAQRLLDAGATARQPLRGTSKGTALAILVRESGLGFRPMRTPDGAIELAVEPLDAADQVWPVGWEPKGPPHQTVPKLFEMLPVDLDDVPLRDVLDAVSTQTGVPIRYDHHGIEAKQLRLDEIQVSFPPRKTSWSLLVRGVTVRHGLKHQVKIDEAGQPFLWITAVTAGAPAR